MLYDHNFVFYVDAIDGLAKSVESSRYYISFAITVNSLAKFVEACQYHIGIKAVVGDDCIQPMGTVPKCVGFYMYAITNPRWSVSENV